MQLGRADAVALRVVDLKVIRGHVSEHGARMLRWEVAGAIQRQPAGAGPRQVRDDHHRLPQHSGPRHRQDRGARQLLTLVF